MPLTAPVIAVPVPFRTFEVMVVVRVIIGVAPPPELPAKPFADATDRAVTVPWGIATHEKVPPNHPSALVLLQVTRPAPLKFWVNKLVLLAVVLNRLVVVAAVVVAKVAVNACRVLEPVAK